MMRQDERCVERRKVLEMYIYLHSLRTNLHVASYPRRLRSRARAADTRG